MKFKIVILNIVRFSTQKNLTCYNSRQQAGHLKNAVYKNL